MSKSPLMEKENMEELKTWISERRDTVYYIWLLEVLWLGYNACLSGGSWALWTFIWLYTGLRCFYPKLFV